MRGRNGRRNGLLLILIALLVYAGCLRWADQWEQFAGFDLPALVTIICGLTSFIGVLLVVASVLPRPRLQLRPTGALPTLGMRRRKQESRAGARFSSLPPFGLFYSLLLPAFIFLFALMHLYSTPIGIRVRIMKDIPQFQSAGYVPLVVYVDLVPRKEKIIFRYFLDSKEIPLPELKGVLEEEMRHRPDKLVFIQAHDDVDYQSVVSAVDATKRAGGTAVLVTSPAKRVQR